MSSQRAIIKQHLSKLKLFDLDFENLNSDFPIERTLKVATALKKQEWSLPPIIYHYRV